jgi:hypothetical protein
VKVLPKLRMTATDAPALDYLLERLGVLNLLQCSNKLGDLLSRNVKDEVWVAGMHPRVDRQAIQPWLITQ